MGLRGVVGATFRPLQDARGVASPTRWSAGAHGLASATPDRIAGVRASVPVPAGRERVPWMCSSSAPSASPLSRLPDCELGHDPVDCDLGCAGSADRGVPTRTRHHNDGNRGRLDPRRR
jgi:hypothetical protein